MNFESSVNLRSRMAFFERTPFDLTEASIDYFLPSVLSVYYFLPLFLSVDYFLPSVLSVLYSILYTISV
jgi:hypothetical protein